MNWLSLLNTTSLLKHFKNFTGSSMSWHFLPLDSGYRCPGIWQLSVWNWLLFNLVKRKKCPTTALTADRENDAIFSLFTSHHWTLHLRRPQSFSRPVMRTVTDPKYLIKMMNEIWNGYKMNRESRFDFCPSLWPWKGQWIIIISFVPFQFVVRTEFMKSDAFK